ncbi:MAG TPA: hypothetical protein ENK32_07000, partial [Anaerolineae bacterium]|nr:hypothetical protein [Anaerolineae bacterium]
MTTDLTDTLVTQLLAQPALEDQVAVLQSANLCDAAGFTALAEYAAGMAFRQPSQAAQLAALCASDAAA